MKLISCSELKGKIDRNDRFILINALEIHRFKCLHIPGSINVFTRVEILKYLKPEDEIVVYCTDTSCNRSILLYYLLEALGYKNVRRFAGGLRRWEEAGYSMVDTVETDYDCQGEARGQRQAQS